MLMLCFDSVLLAYAILSAVEIVKEVFIDASLG